MTDHNDHPLKNTMTRLNRNRVRRVAAGLTVVAALATTTLGCGTTGDQADSKPSAAGSPARSPEPLPSQDWNRLACQALPTDMLETLDNLGDTRKAAEYAAKSSDDVMRQHGRTLRDAVTSRETADLNSDRIAAVDANLDISQAVLDMAESCSTLYGDGQW